MKGSPMTVAGWLLKERRAFYIGLMILAAAGCRVLMNIGTKPGMATFAKYVTLILLFSLVFVQSAYRIYYEAIPFATSTGRVPMSIARFLRPLSDISNIRVLVDERNRVAESDDLDLNIWFEVLSRKGIVRRGSLSQPWLYITPGDLKLLPAGSIVVVPHYLLESFEISYRDIFGRQANLNMVADKADRFGPLYRGYSLPLDGRTREIEPHPQMGQDSNRVKQPILQWSNPYS